MSDPRAQPTPPNPLPGVISIDPERMHGTPVFEGTRVPIEYLFEYISAGDTVDEFLRQFPGVKRDDVTVVLEAARNRLLGRLDAA